MNDDSDVLTEIAAQARRSGHLALDTEFMGEGRYRTLLCLIQLAVPDHTAGLRIELVDPLHDSLDGAPLADVLADPDVEVVVHAGRQDIALLRRRFQTPVRNIFDTQVAAGFAGLAAQTSYETLLSELLGVRLAKSASFTRWDARPLTREQLAYAREDVVHLLELAAELQRRLAASGACSGRARSAARWSRSQRRARRGCDLRAPAPHPQPERGRAGDRARARRLARAHRRRAGPHRSERARRRGAGRARQAPPRHPARAGADPRLRPGRPAPPRRRAARRRARAAATARRPRSSASRAARRPTPRTRRWSRSAKRSCAPARAKPTSPTS